MIGVVSRGIAHYFSVDMCSARHSVFEALKNQYPGAFAHYKAVALLVKRTAGCSRAIVPST